MIAKIVEYFNSTAFSVVRIFFFLSTAIIGGYNIVIPFTFCLCTQNLQTFGSPRLFPCTVTLLTLFSGSFDHGVFPLLFSPVHHMLTLPSGPVHHTEHHLGGGVRSFRRPPSAGHQPLPLGTTQSPTACRRTSVAPPRRCIAARRPPPTRWW